MRNTIRPSNYLSQFALVPLLLVICATATSQQNEPFQINLIFHATDNSPIRFTTHSLRLKQSGHGFDFRLNQPADTPQGALNASLPTRMLVVFDPGLAADPHAVADTLPDLDPVWRLGWEVSFVLPNGSATPYLSSETQLQQRLSAPAAGLNASPTDVALNATKSLGDFPGRRILLYVSNPGKTTYSHTSPSLRILKQQARQELAKVYVVDGGEPRSSGSSTIGSQADFYFAPAQNLDDGYVFDAMTLHDAVKGAILGAREFYTLTVQCVPGGCPNAHLPLSLEILNGFKGKVISDGVGSAAKVHLLVKDNY